MVFADVFTILWMIIIGVLGVLWIIMWILILIERFKQESWNRGTEPFFASIIMWLLILYGLYSFYQARTVNSSTSAVSYIVSLERQSETQWSFVLWFGSVEWVMTYYAYQQLSANEYVLIKRSWYSRIKESDSRKPWFYSDSVCSKPWIFWRCKHPKYIIVPKWTIKKEFNL